MKILRFLKWTATYLALLGIVMPPGRVQAAAQSGRQTTNAVHQQTGSPQAPVIRAQTPQIVDVALSSGGTLTGLVIDTDGFAVAGIDVVMYQDGRQLVATVTNESGYFAVTNLNGGVYQIAAGDGQGTFRCWAENTAPPAAEQQATIVISGNTPPVVHEEACEVQEEKHLGVDVITLSLLGLAIAGLVIALHDEDDEVPPFIPPPASP